MTRRPRHRNHLSHDRWLVSYADFITLLFAFFVVLYASSQMDRKKVIAVSEAIKGAFEQLAVFPESASQLESTTPPVSAREPSQPPKPSATVIAVNDLLPDINKLKADLEDALGEQIQNHEIEVHSTPEGLVVSLREVGFFNSGDSTLLPEGVSTIARIAQILNRKKFQIRVEGHTDNVPIHKGRFRSNWELSTARATEVVQMLIEQHGFDPSLVSAAGYSEYRPIASNDTGEGRKQNRRVDVVVVAHVPDKNATVGSTSGQ